MTSEARSPQKKSRIDPKEPFGILPVIRLWNVSSLCNAVGASPQGIILKAVILISNAKTAQNECATLRTREFQCEACSSPRTWSMPVKVPP